MSTSIKWIFIYFFVYEGWVSGQKTPKFCLRSYWIPSDWKTTGVWNKSWPINMRHQVVKFWTNLSTYLCHEHLPSIMAKHVSPSGSLKYFQSIWDPIENKARIIQTQDVPKRIFYWNFRKIIHFVKKRLIHGIKSSTLHRYNGHLTLPPFFEFWNSSALLRA